MDTQAARLKLAREAAGYASAAAAARSIGVGVSTYRHHENGNRQLNRKAAWRYARFFAVEPLWLFSGEGPMSANDIEKEAVRLVRAMSPDERAVWFSFGQLVVGKREQSG